MVREEHHGRELNNKMLKKLKIHQSTKEEVIDLLGHPSSSSTFNDNIWYYISLKKQGISIFKPNITDQTVVRLKFKNNILVEVKKYKPEQGKTFKFSKKQTKVEGNKHTILKDFVHNLGRYNKEPSKSNDY